MTANDAKLQIRIDMNDWRGVSKAAILTLIEDHSRIEDRLKTAEAMLKRARDRYEGGQLVGRDWADHATAFLRGDE